jgi:hypothetical protein
MGRFYCRTEKKITAAPYFLRKKNSNFIISLFLNFSTFFLRLFHYIIYTLFHDFKFAKRLFSKLNYDYSNNSSSEYDHVKYKYIELKDGTYCKSLPSVGV